jgi:MoaA/NifB/PqqE/SkfB family radical SAM enzyme
VTLTVGFLPRLTSWASASILCEFRWLCGGSRSRAYARTGDPLGPDPLCPYVPDDGAAGG